MGLLDILKAIPLAAGEKARADEFGPDYRQRWQKYQDEHVRSELQNAISTTEQKSKALSEAARIRAALMGKPEGTTPEEALGTDAAAIRDLQLKHGGLVNTGLEQGQGFAVTEEARKAAEEGRKTEEFPLSMEKTRADMSNDRIRAQAASRAAEASMLSANNRGGMGLDLTDEGLSMMAKLMIAGGKLPTGLGMGNNPLKTKIINEAGRLDPNANLAGNAANFAADAAALKTLMTSRATVGAYSGMAEQNMQRLEAAAGNVIDTGFPPLNAKLRDLDRATGGEAQAEYDAARQVAINEIARIISSTPNLAGQLTDTARREVEAFNPEGATLSQSIRVLKLLNAEVKSRATNLDIGIKEIRSRLGGAETAPETTKSRFRILSVK